MIPVWLSRLGAKLLPGLLAAAALLTASACAETYGGGSVAGALPTAALVPGVPPGPACQSIDDLGKALATRYGEYPTIGGQLGTEEAASSDRLWLAVIFTDPQSRSWTLAYVDPSGNACVQAYGINWAPNPDAPTS